MITALHTEDEMAKRCNLVVFVFLFFVSLSAWGFSQEQAPAPAKSEVKALKVTVSYQGKGKVDKNHGIYLFLFNTPDFVTNPGSAMPIAFQAVYANDDAVTFSALSGENVYLTAAYDEAGNYSIQSGPPPSGSPVALFRPGDPQAPTPVKLEENKTVEITFSFDDSIRMP
jgi:hypothetical protein